MQINSYKRNSVIDSVKGISIILVVITHFRWEDYQRLNPIFPYLINMAVPIFMIVSGFVGAYSYNNNAVKRISEAYNYSNIVPKFIKYTIPYLITVLYQLFDPRIQLPESKSNIIKWIIIGTNGPGSYYFPILMQLVFVFPIIYFIIVKNGYKGLFLLLFANIVYEVITWAYEIPVECYRLLVFRYIFIIAFGVYIFYYDIKPWILFLICILGSIYILIVYYRLYEPKILIMKPWNQTNFIASMWICPFVYLLIRKTYFKYLPFSIIGKSSYNILFVQLIYHIVYSYKIDTANDYVGIIIGTIMCLIIGVLIGFIEKPITNLISKKSIESFNKLIYK